MAWAIRIVGAALTGALLWLMLFESDTWTDVGLSGGLAFLITLTSWLLAAWWEDTEKSK
jgi:hypothetical protein